MNEWLVFIVTALLLAGFYALNARADKPFEGKRFSAVVSYVYDGDTVQLQKNKLRVRLWGIDAPEKGEPGADAARKALIKLIDGKKVSVLPIDKDRYGRTVARIFLKNGRDVSALMIEQGHAIEYRRFTKGYYSRP